MIRYVVCIGAVSGIVWAVRGGLHAALTAFGFGPYMWLCIGLTAFFIAAAFAWDRYEARRSQELLPPQPRHFPPQAPPQRFPAVNSTHQ